MYGDAITVRPPDYKLSHGVPGVTCYPCPYDASCCARRTVSDREAAAIELNPAWIGVSNAVGRVADTSEEQTLRSTATGCTIHNKPYYPTVCRRFPWSTQTGGGTSYDVTICGGFVARQVGRDSARWSGAPSNLERQPPVGMMLAVSTMRMTER